MRNILLIVAGLMAVAISQAFAHFPATGPSTSDSVERVACRIVQYRSGGAVTTRQICNNAPAVKSNCRLVTRRIIKAGGEAVVKTRQQCD
jgi:hypothetical protein